MKRILSILGVMGLIASSCTQNEELTATPSKDGSVVFCAAIDGEPESKATLSGRKTTWEVDDEIVVVANDGDTEERSLTYKIEDAESGAMQPLSSADKYYPSTTGGVDYVAYYPNDVMHDSSNNISLDIADQSTPVKPLLRAEADNQSSESVSLQFSHCYVRLEFNLFAGGIDIQNLAGVKGELCDAMSKGVFNINDATWTDLTSEDIELNIAVSGDSKTATISTYVLPTDEVRGVVSLNITVGDKVFTPHIATASWTAGKLYKYNIKVGKAPADLIWDDSKDLYEIKTAAGLEAFASIVNNETTNVGMLTIDGFNGTSIAQDKTAKGKLANDIDLSEVCGDGIGDWTPIGNEANKYAGTFDGNGFELQNIYVNNDNSHQGLFGYTDGATIEDVSISGSITAKEFVGGVVGSANNSTIIACRNSAVLSATGESTAIGGVVGNAGTSSSITACYNLAGLTIAGNNSSLGGVVGNAGDSSTITACYNSAKLTTTGSSSNVGGVVGYTDNTSTFNGCYWIDIADDNATRGVANGDDTIPKFTQIASLNSSLVRLNNAIAVWNDNNSKRCNYKYQVGENVEVDTPTLTTGAPTYKYLPPTDLSLINGVYEIRTAAGLVAFASIVNNANTNVGELTTDGLDTNIPQDRTINGKLLCNIDLSSVCGASLGSGGVDWIPIGNEDNKYEGSFDGCGFEVQNIYINNTLKYQGLFGFVYCNFIRNVGVTGSITATKHVGGIAGHSEGYYDPYCSIVGCYNAATITWNEDSDSSLNPVVGGIVGSAFHTWLIACYNIGKITTNKEDATVGGISGYFNTGTIIASYNSAEIEVPAEKNTYVGALFGSASESYYEHNAIYWVDYADDNVDKGMHLIDEEYDEDTSIKVNDISSLNDKVSELNAAIDKWNAKFYANDHNRYEGYHYVAGANKATDVPTLVKITD